MVMTKLLSVIVMIKTGKNNRNVVFSLFEEVRVIFAQEVKKNDCPES